MRVRFGEFLLDSDSRQLFRDGTEVHLQPTTFELPDLLPIEDLTRLRLGRVRVLFRSAPEDGAMVTESRG